MLRTIFDRSAFHGDAFEQLRASPLERLCRQGKLGVFHTPIFLEETLAMYGNEKNRGALLQQWPFIMGICNGGIFRTRDEMFRDELVRNRGPHARLLRTAMERQIIENKVNANIFTDGPWVDWVDTMGDRDEKYQKKKTQKQIYSELRQGLSAMLEQKGHRAPPRDYPFSDHLAAQIDLYGRSIVEHQIKSKNSLALQNQWSRYMERYPFVTAFTEGFAYAGYYAAIHQNAPVDINAQADYEMMTYLLHADILVSNDTTFLRNAFMTLWKPRGKVLFTTGEFVNFIAQL